MKGDCLYAPWLELLTEVHSSAAATDDVQSIPVCTYRIRTHIIKKFVVFWHKCFCNEMAIMQTYNY